MTFLFTNRPRLLAALAALWVLLLLLSHWQLPERWVWWVAATFSILMNLVYVSEALGAGQQVRTELAVAGVLIVASLLGALVSPVFVILAVFAHGAWDVAKHFGAGVRFLSWYNFGCAACDFLYAALLALYWLL